MGFGIIQILILVFVIGAIITPFILLKKSREEKEKQGEVIEDLPPYKWGYFIAIIIGGLNGGMMLASSVAVFNILGIMFSLLVMGLGYAVFLRYRVAWIAVLILLVLSSAGAITEFDLPLLIISVITLSYSGYYTYSRWEEFKPIKSKNKKIED